MTEPRMDESWRCPRCGWGGDWHVQEERLGVEVELERLAPNEAVAWGNGRTTHLLVRCRKATP